MDTAINQNEQGNPQLSDTKLNVIQPHLTWNYHVYVICYGTSHISTDNYYSPSQQEAGLKSGLTTGRFQPILEKLTNLERDHPKLAFQAARAIGLYRYTSASCVSLSLDNEKLDPYGQTSTGASVKLHDAKDGLQPCPDKQLSRFHRFERGLKLSRERLMGAVEDWNQCSKGDLARMVDKREELPAEECDTSVS